MRFVSDLNRETQGTRIISDDVDRPDRSVAAGYEAIQINQRNAPQHAHPQTDIVTVFRVRASVSVTNQTIGSDFVFIRAGPAFPDGDRREAQGQFQYGGLKDALRCDERHPFAFKLKTCFEDRTRDRITVYGNLFLKEAEGLQTDLNVEI